MGFSDDDLTKLMGSLGMGDAGGDKDMEDFLPFMSNMMQKLLSKELLQPVLVDIVDRVSYHNCIQRTVVVRMKVYVRNVVKSLLCLVPGLVGR